MYKFALSDFRRYKILHGKGYMNNYRDNLNCMIILSPILLPV